jgi:putative membrane protein
MSAPGPLDLLTHWELGAPLATLAAAGGAYGLGVRGARSWPARRSACFAAGLAVLAVALLSGVDAWAARLQSVHMAQHMLLLLVAPPLLAAGAPISLGLRTLRPRARRRLAAVLRHPLAGVIGHPAFGLAALTGAMLAVHLTALYEAATTDGSLHAAEHAGLLLAGLAFWTPLVGADPGPHRAGAAGRVAWLLAAMAPMGALSAVLLTAAPRSGHYAASAAAAGVDPAADQRAAATVMWIGGTLLLTLAVLALAGTALWQE